MTLKTPDFPTCARYRILTALALSEIIGIQMCGSGSLLIDDKVTVWADGRVFDESGLITQLDEHQTEAIFQDTEM